MEQRLVAQDRTERRRANEEIRAREAKLQTTSITDGFLVLDRNWRYSYFNETGARMIGVRREDMIGGCVWDLFPHAHGTKFYEGYHRAVATGKPVHFEEFYPEPLHKWLECHCYPSDEGLSVYFHDITERKRTESELQRLAQQRQLALNAARLGWWSYDPVTKLATWDERFKEIFEVSASRAARRGNPPAHSPRSRYASGRQWEEALYPANPKPYSSQDPASFTTAAPSPGSKCTAWPALLVLAPRDEPPASSAPSRTSRSASKQREPFDKPRTSCASMPRTSRKLSRTAPRSAGRFTSWSNTPTVFPMICGPSRAMNQYAHCLLEDYGEKFDSEGQLYLKRISVAGCPTRPSDQ